MKAQLCIGFTYLNTLGLRDEDAGHCKNLDDEAVVRRCPSVTAITTVGGGAKFCAGADVGGRGGWFFNTNMRVVGSRNQLGKLALLLWASCLMAVLPGRGRADSRGTVIADGFREPMKAGCWGCDSEPSVTLGTIQYGVTASDSQLSEGVRP